MDFVIKNCRLVDKPGEYYIKVEDGKISLTMKELEDKDQNETVDTEEEQETPTSYNEEMSYTPFADLFKKLKL